MLTFVLVSFYLFVGLICSIIAHAGLTLAAKNNLGGRYDFISETIANRDVVCPVLMGLFWPAGLAWLVILFSGNAYQFVSDYIVTQINKFVEPKE